MIADKKLLIFLFSSLLPFLIYSLKVEVKNLPNSSIVPYEVPLYSQCDPLWANDLMDTKTICAVGCAMSSTAMGLAGASISIPDSLKAHLRATSTSASTPKTLNAWLKENGGYTGSNDIIWTSVPAIAPDLIYWPDDGFHKVNDMEYDDVVKFLEKGRIVIANVNNGGHFVLVTGYDTDKDTLYVNDPGYAKYSYSHTKDIVGYRMFDVVRV